MDREDTFTIRVGRRTSRKLAKRRRRLRFLLAIPLIAMAIFLTFVAFMLGTTSSALRGIDIGDLENVHQSTPIYDSKGQIITNIHGVENRIKVSLEDVPIHVQNAFIATEDIRFYSHPGFDIKRLASSLLANIRAGAYVQGGGTITQQVARNTFLSQKKVLSRKIQEIYLAYELEQRYSKDQILQSYLNLIYFGNGAYGVETASNHYFGKSVKEISVAQGAMLAGIIKNPSRYSPFLNEEESMKRKDLVLDLMVLNGYLSKEEGEATKKEPMGLKDDVAEGYVHSYFIDMVLEEASRVLKVKEEDLLTGGYKIYTSLDKKLQEFCESIFKKDEFFPKSPESNEPCQGSIIVLDSKTGEVRSLIGGKIEEKPIRKAFNRAIQARRQPGSIIKPLVVYAPALEGFGYSPATFINDEPITIDDYSPSNYDGDYRGWMTIREALAASINIPAVKVLHDIGINRGMSFAKGLGIPFSSEDRNLSIALGGFHIGISPMELARAYMPFADEGKYKDYTTVLRIDDARGNNIYMSNPQKVQYFSEETAFLINNMLKSSIEWPTGTASSLKSLNIPLAAKTGTVQLPATPEFQDISGIKDAWIAVYNPDYVVTVWQGFDETSSKNYLPPEAVGGAFTADISRAVIEHIYKSNDLTEVVDFERPPGILEVELDARALKNQHMALLASPFTPDDQIVREFFTQNNAPSLMSDYWAVPATPENFMITPASGGFPKISFNSTQSFAKYNIYRVQKDKNARLVHALTAENQSRLEWIDKNVLPGETYEYYVIASHPEILIENIPLESAATTSISFTFPQKDHKASSVKKDENEEDFGSRRWFRIR